MRTRGCWRNLFKAEDRCEVCSIERPYDVSTVPQVAPFRNIIPRSHQLNLAYSEELTPMSAHSKSVAYGALPYRSRLSDCLHPPTLSQLPWPSRSRSQPSHQPLSQELAEVPAPPSGEGPDDHIRSGPSATLRQGKDQYGYQLFHHHVSPLLDSPVDLPAHMLSRKPRPAGGRNLTIQKGYCSTRVLSTQANDYETRCKFTSLAKYPI